MITIDEMQTILDELAEELPADFYRYLNGGIILLPEVHTSPHSSNDDLYILGEYHSGGIMGNYISIYYGSFERLYSYLGEEAIKNELRIVLRHEFRHHMETMAGEKDLIIEDEKYIKNYLSKKNNQK